MLGRPLDLDPGRLVWADPMNPLVVAVEFVDSAGNFREELAEKLFDR